jgi:hypothetical protein
MIGPSFVSELMIAEGQPVDNFPESEGRFPDNPKVTCFTFLSDEIICTNDEADQRVN